MAKDSNKSRPNLYISKKAKELLRQYAFYKKMTQTDALEELLLSLEDEVNRLKKEN
jgi:flavoprotein